MKASLKISLLLNAVLLCVLAVILANRHESPPTRIGKYSTQFETPAIAAPPSVITNVVQKPFRWSQLESTDYHLYIKNLRAIGCPEQTLRDIVTADLDNLFAKKTRDLEQQLDALANAPLAERLASETALRAEIKNLPAEQSSAIEQLLGIPALVAQVDPLPAPAPTRRTRPQVEQPIAMPLVFADFDLAALHLDANRLQVIAALRQRFLDELGGADVNPNDPAYLDRWKTAQPEVDNLLRGMIGINAYSQYDLAARAARQNTTSNQ